MINAKMETTAEMGPNEESSNLIGPLPCDNSWYSTPIITPLRAHAVN